MDYMTYIKPELLVLIPVLMCVGAAIKNGGWPRDKNIPLCLMLVGFLLALLYVVGTSELETARQWAMCVFTAAVQGALSGWGAVGAHQTVKQKTGGD